MGIRILKFITSILLQGVREVDYLVVSYYDRLIQIISSLFLPLTIIMHYLSEKETDIYFCDSTYFAVCRNVKVSQN